MFEPAATCDLDAKKINAKAQRREDAKIHSQALFASLRLRVFALNSFPETAEPSDGKEQ